VRAEGRLPRWTISIHDSTYLCSQHQCRSSSGGTVDPREAALRIQEHPDHRPPRTQRFGGAGVRAGFRAGLEAAPVVRAPLDAAPVVRAVVAAAAADIRVVLEATAFRRAGFDAAAFVRVVFTGGVAACRGSLDVLGTRTKSASSHVKGGDCRRSADRRSADASEPPVVRLSSRRRSHDTATGSSVVFRMRASNRRSAPRRTRISVRPPCWRGSLSGAMSGAVMESFGLDFMAPCVIGIRTRDLCSSVRIRLVAAIPPVSLACTRPGGVRSVAQYPR
jgi:hypothetical protein